MDATLYVSKIEAAEAMDIKDYIEREYTRMQLLTIEAERKKRNNLTVKSRKGLKCLQN